MGDDRSEAERLRAMGLKVETVGDILERGQERREGEAFVWPVLPDYPYSFPEPGIYFGLDEETYHAIPALSYGGVKKLAASPMVYWAACRWLNPNWEPPEQKDHFDVGHAYHCRILEGREAFEAHFAVDIDKRDFPDCLVTVDDIEKAFPEGVKPKGKTKREKFEHLRTLDATAELWDDIKAAHDATCNGRTMISAKTYHMLEIAGAMIDNDPELSTVFKGGHPEVSLFWYCPRSGIPMKMRADYLKIKMMVDLKTLQNSQEASIENAIRRDIANRRYAVQPSVYFEGADTIRQLVRERGASAIFSADLTGEEPEAEAKHGERVAWAMKWASHRAPDEWLWVYIQKGEAPIARGLFYPRAGTTKMLCDDIVRMMKKRYREFAGVFGTDPWLDVKPIYDLADEDLPPWATEI